MCFVYLARILFLRATDSIGGHGDTSGQPVPFSNTSDTGLLLYSSVQLPISSFMSLRIISSSGYVANACIDCNLDYPNMIFREFFSIKYQKFYTKKWLNHAGFSDFRNFLFGFLFLTENFSSLSTKKFFQKIQCLCGFQRFCHFLIWFFVLTLSIMYQKPKTAVISISTGF